MSSQVDEKPVLAKTSKHFRKICSEKGPKAAASQSWKAVLSGAGVSFSGLELNPSFEVSFFLSLWLQEDFVTPEGSFLKGGPVCRMERVMVSSDVGRK